VGLLGIVIVSVELGSLENFAELLIPVSQAEMVKFAPWAELPPVQPEIVAANVHSAGLATTVRHLFHVLPEIWSARMEEMSMDSKDPVCVSVWMGIREKIALRKTTARTSVRTERPASTAACPIRAQMAATVSVNLATLVSTVKKSQLALKDPRTLNAQMEENPLVKPETVNVTALVDFLGITVRFLVHVLLDLTEMPATTEAQSLAQSEPAHVLALVPGSVIIVRPLLLASSAKTEKSAETVVPPLDLVRTVVVLVLELSKEITV